MDDGLPLKVAESFRTVGRRLLLAAVFFAPFFFFPATANPVDTNKFLFVDLFIIAAAICFLGCILEERRIEYPGSLFALSIIVFLAIQGISAFFSISPDQSFWGNLTAPDSLLSFLLYAALFFLFFFFFERKDIPKVFLAMAGGLFVATLIGLFSKFGNPVGSVGAWGILMALVIVAIAVVDFSTISASGSGFGMKKWILLFALAIAVLAVIVVNGQFFWLLIAGFVMIIAALRFEPKKNFLLASGIIVLALFFAFISPHLTAFPDGLQGFQPGVSPTFVVAYGVLSGWRALIGSGPTTFALDYTAFRPASVNATAYWSTIFPQGHDFISTILATSGILGLLSFLIILLLALRPVIRIEFFDNDLAMASGAAAWLFVALFFYPASFAELIFLFALLGLLHADSARRVINFKHLSRQWSFSASFAIMLVAAALLSGVFIAGERYMAAVFDAQADILASAGNLDSAFAKVNQAVALNRSDAYLRDASNILLDEARILAVSQNPDSADELPIVTGNSIMAAGEATTIGPYDAANWGNLGAIYESIMPLANGADALAEASYQKAIGLDPANPQWDVAMARTLMESAALLPQSASSQSIRQSQWSSAENFLIQAIALKNDYADSRVLLVQLYLQEGNTAQAIEKVQELKEQNPLDPGVAFELGYLYYETGQLPDAQEEFQVATILDPNYSNARYYLGLIYTDAGETPQALDEFNKIEALNPGNAAVANIIANLQAGRAALANVSPSSVPLESQSPTEIVASTSTAPQKSAVKKK